MFWHDSLLPPLTSYLSPQRRKKQASVSQPAYNTLKDLFSQSCTELLRTNLRLSSLHSSIPGITDIMQRPGHLGIPGYGITSRIGLAC